MNRFRIVHLAQCAGGVDRYLRMLLGHTDRSRFELILIASEDYQEAVYRNLTDRFVQIDMCNALSPRKDAAAICRVRQLLKELKPDLLYCHSSKAGGIGRIAAIGLEIPVVYNPHGWAFNMKGSRLKSIVYLWIERMLACFTTRFVVISNNEKLSAIEHRMAGADKIKVIFNGVDLQALEKTRRQSQVTRVSLGIPKTAYLIGMVGRLSKQKAPDVFIRMAARLTNDIPESFFIMVGDGEERHQIEEMAAEAGLSDRLLITGWVENPTAYTVLFDQAVLLSRWEGFGLVLAEYMKLGKPVVATAVDAIPDLITDHENGLLVGMDNDGEAALAVEKIYRDKALKQKLIRNGMMRVNAFFNIERVADEHARLFVNIINFSGGVKSNLLFKEAFCSGSAFDWERRAAA